MAHWHTPRSEWPSRAEADREPPSVSDLSPAERAALVAEVAALQAAVCAERTGAAT